MKLFFLTPDQMLMSVRFEVRGSAFVAGKPEKILDLSAFGLPRAATPFDVSAIDGRVLIIKAPKLPAPPLMWMQNFAEELRALLEAR